MTNVVRPNFGHAKLPEREHHPSGWLPVEGLGGAAGHFIGLTRSVWGEGEGSVRLFTWPASGSYIETIASFASQQGAIDAGMLIVRALEIIESGKEPKQD